jgi:hypothetical protein
MIDHVEAFGPARPVNAAAIDEADELALGVVAQEGHQFNQIGRLRDQRQLAIGDLHSFDQICL